MTGARVALKRLGSLKGVRAGVEKLTRNKNRNHLGGLRLGADNRQLRKIRLR